MARIPDEEIERLKKEVSLERLVAARGVELVKKGADLVGRCPFHEDKTPSLVVSPKKNLWHCLGACQTGGSVIDWVMKVEGVSFRHAVELLRSDALLVGRTWAGAQVKVATVRKLPPPVAADADDATALGQVVAYYHETLKKSPEALGYLEARGIRSEEAIEHFQLGYANRTLGLRLPMKNRDAGAELRGRLQRLGVLRESGHEHLAGSLVVPLLDAAGTVVGMYGRKIHDELRPGTPKHLYLPGPHRGVWNFRALRGSKEVILCEALLDALTFWCAGLRNVTAAYGVEGFTSEMLAALTEAGVETVHIAFDRDEAGDRGAEAVGKRLIEAGLACDRVQFPRGMDANEYALKVKPAAKSLELAVRRAIFVGRGKSTAAAPPPALPPAPASHPSLAAPPAADVDGDEVRVAYGDRQWRVRGLARNTSFDSLKVNLHVSQGEAFHVDTLDVYAARARAGFARQAADELGVEEDVVKADLGRLLLALEQAQDKRIRGAMESGPARPAMTEAEEAAALALLRDPRLCERILEDFRQCGVVGEETNKLCGYLAAISRKLDEPLAVVIQSSSAAGKSALMEAVLAFVPEEERVQYAAMTGQSLFYMGETDLAHKVLAIVEEEGASRASYALKILQSEGELTIASTGKDPETGRLVTHEYRVAGPVMIFLTTTAIEIDEELLNRCLVLTVDEERGQTRAIHELQRASRGLAGRLEKRDRQAVLKVHRDAQRLLRPLVVVNPFAERLTFPDHRTRTRRDHPKYLTLIDTIALLYQHQREVKTAEHRGERVEYIEVTFEDIAIANRIAHQVLGRSLDELPPQTRRLLGQLDALVRGECERLAMRREDFRFTRRQVREAMGWSYEQVRVHMERLVELEYVLVHRGERGQTFVYELAYDGGGMDGTPHLPGLIDLEALGATTTTGTLGGSTPGFGVPLGAHTGPIPGGYRSGLEHEIQPKEAGSDDISHSGAENAHLGTNGEKRPYVYSAPTAPRA